MKFGIVGAFMICLLLMTTKMYALTLNTVDSCDKLVKRYIKSIVTSDYRELTAVLDESLSFNETRLNHLRVFNRSTIVDDIKLRNGMHQDFKPAYVVLAQSDAFTIVQVDFAYGDTVMQNFLFLEKDRHDEWKITKVYELYKVIDNINLPNSIALSK